jgi:hypothetical protein
MTIKLRTMTEIEKAAIEKLARSRTTAAREVERARMIVFLRQSGVGEKGSTGAGHQADAVLIGA